MRPPTNPGLRDDDVFGEVEREVNIRVVSGREPCWEIDSGDEYGGLLGLE